MLPRTPQFGSEPSLADRLEDRNVWMAMKAVYSGLIQERSDWELAETFFNSVTRKIFSTVGVDPRIEFVDTDYDSPPMDPVAPVYDTYEGPADTASLVRRIIEGAELDVDFEDFDGDAVEVARQIDDRLQRVGGLRLIDRIEMVNSTFFRSKGAYLVGRVWSGSQAIPLVIAMLHEDDGVVIDAVLPHRESGIDPVLVHEVVLSRRCDHAELAGSFPLDAHAAQAAR